MPHFWTRFDKGCAISVMRKVEFVIESRWAEGQYARLNGLAAELVALKVDLIVTHGVPRRRGQTGDHEDPHRSGDQR